MPRTTTAMRALRAIVSAAVALLVLAGCVRIDGDLTLNGAGSPEPDTVSGTLLVAISDEWSIAQGQDPTSFSDAILEELAAAAGSGVTGEPYAADGYTGVSLVLDDVGLDRISQASDGALQITHEGEEYTLSADLGALSGDAAEPLPWSVDAAITFPGDVTAHNGTLDGRTVSWTLDQTSTDATLYATSGGAPTSFWSRVPVPLIALTILAGAGAAMAWWFSRRAKKEQADGGFRARQARARGTSTSNLDDMLESARSATVSPKTRPGAKPRRGGSRR